MTQDLEDDPYLSDLPDREVKIVIIDGFRSRIQPALQQLYKNSPTTQDTTETLSHPADQGIIGESSELSDIFRICLGSLERQWSKGQHDEALLEISQLFSVLSRDRTWAIAFAENGVLDFFLVILQPQVSDSQQWVDGALRLIANCCSRSARTKQSTVPRAPFARLVKRLEQVSTADTSAMAIYAISNGMTDALGVLEDKHHLIAHVLEGLAKGFYLDEHLDFLFELIDGVLPKVCVDSIQAPQLQSIFNCMINLDIPTENLVVLVNLVSTLLESERIRQMILENELDYLLTAFLSTFPLGNISDVDDCLTGGHYVNRELTTDEDIGVLRSSLILLFGKITLSLRQLGSVDRQLMRMLNWLQASEPQVRICACVFFGNIAFNHPQLGSMMLVEYRLGVSLNKCISSTSDREALTSAFELLQNLAKIENRDILGRSGILESLAERWETFSMHSARALYHTRQLLNSSTSNTSRFLGHDLDASQHLKSQSPLLQRLLMMFGRTEDDTMKAETGQVVAEVWRNISREASASLPEGSRDSSGSHSDPTTRPLRNVEDVTEANDFQSTYAIKDKAAKPARASPTKATAHPDPMEHPLLSFSMDIMFATVETVSILEPVLYMIRSENETLISLGWFTLSLMARVPEGSVAVYNKLLDGGDGFELVRQTMDSSNTQAGARNNALYLVATLTRQLSSREHCIKRLKELPMKVTVDESDE